MYWNCDGNVRQWTAEWFLLARLYPIGRICRDVGGLFEWIWKSRLHSFYDTRRFHQEHLWLYVCEHDEFDPNVNFWAELKERNFRAGTLDPWYSGCVNQSRIDPQSANPRGVYVFTMEGSAHHLDLRTPNTCDPPNVVNERFQVFTDFILEKA